MRSRDEMVLEALTRSKQVERQKDGSRGSLRSWACGREFRVDSLSASQNQLLEHDGPVPADFVGHDEFQKDEEIPVVDMALFDGDTDAVKRNVLQMVAACEEWGYFYLINHGVELQLMHKVEQQAYDFFSMSTVEKSKHSSHYSLLEKVKRWSEWVTIKPAEGKLDEYDNQLSPPDNNHEFSCVPVLPYNPFDAKAPSIGCNYVLLRVRLFYAVACSILSYDLILKLKMRDYILFLARAYLEQII